MTVAVIRSPSTGAPARPSRRTLVLVLAAFTVVVEVCSYANILPTIDVDGLPISASVIPGLALALACGDRLLGRSAARRSATAYWLVILSAVAALTLGFFRLHRPVAVPGLIIAAFDEELVYRLAVPAVLALLLRRANVSDQRARIAGLAFAGLWFVLLPGHRGQMTSPALALPFLAFAALAAILVYRSGSILPVAVAHAVSNLLTVLMWNDALAKDARSALLGSVLILLALAYGRSRHLVHGDDGRLVDVRTGCVVEIDLRDGERPSATMADGEVIPLDRPQVAGG